MFFTQPSFPLLRRVRTLPDSRCTQGSNEMIGRCCLGVPRAPDTEMNDCSVQIPLALGHGNQLPATGGWMQFRLSGDLRTPSKPQRVCRVCNITATGVQRKFGAFGLICVSFFEGSPFCLCLKEATRNTEAIFGGP